MYDDQESNEEPKAPIDNGADAQGRSDETVHDQPVNRQPMPHTPPLPPSYAPYPPQPPRQPAPFLPPHPSGLMASTSPVHQSVQHDPVMELPEIPVNGYQVQPVSSGNGEYQSPPVRSGGRGFKLVASALALVVLTAGVASGTTWMLARRYQMDQIPIGLTGLQSSGSQPVSAGAVQGANVIPAVYRRVIPSVVSIKVQSKSGSGQGSGFVVDPKGYILTNNHVIDGASKVTVSFVDGTTLDGKVVGSDQYKDLAIVQVDAGNRPLIAAALGDSNNVQVGELTIAIGAPFGQEFTVTSGIVSALDRSISEANSPFPIPGAIQTDAAINPGNSGGPLFNANGEVIGINTAIDGPVRGNVGIGFAVPINSAKEILPTLTSGKQVEYAYLGIGPATLSAQQAQELNLPSGTTGVLVGDVLDKTPAAEAGLKAATTTRAGKLVTADVITALDGKPVKSAEDLLKHLSTRKVGDSLEITVLRGKETLTLRAKLVARPANTQN